MSKQLLIIMISALGGYIWCIIWNEFIWKWLMKKFAIEEKKE